MRLCQEYPDNCKDKHKKCPLYDNCGMGEMMRVPKPVCLLDCVNYDSKTEKCRFGLKEEADKCKKFVDNAFPDTGICDYCLKSIPEGRTICRACQKGIAQEAKDNEREVREVREDNRRRNDR